MPKRTIMKNRICFITTGDIAMIATAKRALGLADHLADLGWTVSILMLDVKENHHRVSLECSDRIDVRYFSQDSAFKEREYKEELLKSINPDVIYYCSFVARNIVGRKSHAVKIIEHSELQSKFQETKNLRLLYYYATEFYSIIFADGILNASHYLQKVYKKRASMMFRSNIPMRVYPYAYNKKVCYYDNRLLKSKRKGEVWFVFMGSLTENYGAFTMLKAFEKVTRLNKDVKLFLLGKGHDYNRVLDYIVKHELENNIIAPGYIKEEDISTFFSAADAFLLPLNNTIQDIARCPSKLYMYLAYNKPIITCKVGEPYKELGEKGLYYEPSDPQSLAQTISCLIHKGKFTLELENPEIYEWKQRAIELDAWINNNFKINK